MRSVVAVAAASLLLAVAGCGDSEEAAGPQTVMTAPTATAPPASTGSVRLAPDEGPTGSPKGSTSLPPLPGESRPRETATTPDGTVMLLPVRPTRSVVGPSPSCTGDERSRPPRPGVRATRVGARQIVVELSFADVPERCRPYGVQITVDVNRDPYAPSTHKFPFADAERPLVVELPERVAEADVISANTFMRSGASSDSVPVLIAAPR